MSIDEIYKGLPHELDAELKEIEAVQLTAILASLIVAVAWSVISKLLAAKEIEVALELPGGSSKETLKDVLKTK